MSRAERLDRRGRRLVRGMPAEHERQPLPRADREVRDGLAVLAVHLNRRSQAEGIWARERDMPLSVRCTQGIVEP